MKCLQAEHITVVKGDLTLIELGLTSAAHIVFLTAWDGVVSFVVTSLSMLYPTC